MVRTPLPSIRSSMAVKPGRLSTASAPLTAASWNSATRAASVANYHPTLTEPTSFPTSPIVAQGGGLAGLDLHCQKQRESDYA